MKHIQAHQNQWIKFTAIWSNCGWLDEKSMKVISNTLHEKKTGTVKWTTQWSKPVKNVWEIIANAAAHTLLRHVWSHVHPRLSISRSAKANSSHLTVIVCTTANQQYNISDHNHKQAPNRKSTDCSSPLFFTIMTGLRLPNDEISQ